MCVLDLWYQIRYHRVMGIEFTVVMHQRPNGKWPTYDALLECERVSVKLRSSVMAGMERLQSKTNHSGQLTEYVSPKLWCLRVKQGNNIARLFFTFLKDRRIILMNGYVKKTEKIPAAQLKKANSLVKEVHAHAQ